LVQVFCSPSFSASANLASPVLVSLNATFGNYSSGIFRELLSEITLLIAICAGYVGDTCGIHIDNTPAIISFLNGERCVVDDKERCDDIHMNAERFAINSRFSCKFVVSIKFECIHAYTRPDRFD